MAMKILKRIQQLPVDTILLGLKEISIKQMLINPILINQTICSTLAMGEFLVPEQPMVLLPKSNSQTLTLSKDNNR